MDNMIVDIEKYKIVNNNNYRVTILNDGSLRSFGTIEELRCNFNNNNWLNFNVGDVWYSEKSDSHRIEEINHDKKTLTLARIKIGL